jgi:hypothetical protein
MISEQEAERFAEEYIAETATFYQIPKEYIADDEVKANLKDFFMKFMNKEKDNEEENGIC